MALDRLSIEKVFGSRFVDGNTVTLLHRGRDTFEAILQGIRNARSLVCLQFYIFRNDETGKEIAGLLKEKAGKGVAVYVLFDHFGSFGTPRSFWEGLRESGVQVGTSRPFAWSSPFHYIHRDHRKLIIIDHEMAFTGGLNIANEYRGFHRRMKQAAWRDTGILLEGGIVHELLKNFRQAWKTWAKTRPPELGPPQAPAAPGLEGPLPAIPIFASSSRGRRKMRKLLYHSIKNAKQSILLTTAYFTPSRRMLESLEDAVYRGVSVRLLVPGVSDVPAAYHAGRAFFSRLLKSGVRIFTYQGEVLHAKSYVFDNIWSVVGSANLDFQSLRWNDEGNVGIFDAGFGERMASVFEEDLGRSHEIRLQEWGRRPLCDKLKEGFFVLFRRRL